jgi:hypothetical protein
VPASDGKRKPPRPEIEIVSADATEEEAAAIASALEQFLAETAPSPQQSAPASGWQRAALTEGVEARRPPSLPWPGDSV